MPGDDGPMTLEALLDRVRSEQGQPAVVAAVVHQSRLLAVGAAGVRILGAPAAAHVEDRFHIGSITKPMTATVIATLVEKGLLHWHTTVSESLPTSAVPPCSEYTSVTIEQLLRHRAGLPSYTHVANGSREDSLLRQLQGTPSEQRRQFVTALLQDEPQSAPGTRMSYSNAGYTLAAHMAETALGRAWESLVQTYLFAPLAMTSAAFGWPSTIDPDHQPWGHRWNDAGGALVPHAPDHPYQLGAVGAPSGDICCNITDLASFTMAHLDGCQGRSPLLSPRTFSYLHTPHDGYAMGWNVQSFGDEQLAIPQQMISSHAGSAGTYYAQVVILHGSQMAFCVATNSGTGERTVSLIPGLLMKRFASALAVAGQ